MYESETVVAECDDAKRFRAAFYRFIELNPPPKEEAAWLKWVAPGMPPAAVLWSRQAAEDFRTFLIAFKKSNGRTGRVNRFDDLWL